MRKWLRFEFLVFSVFLLIPFLAFSGGSQGAAPAGSDAPDSMATIELEAPELAQQVRAGNLPPLSQRLPMNPYVQDVVESTGKYGGTLRRVFTGTADRIGLGNPTHEFLVRLDFTGTKVEPNVAESWEISADSRTYTFQLREGMKWSDGSPFVSDDIIFFWDNVITNREVFYDGDIPNWYVSPISRTPVTFTKINDYRFQMTFADPYPNFLFNLASNYSLMFHHVGHLKSILPSFIGETAALALAEKEGFSGVKDMLTWKIKYPYMWPEIPSIRAWIAVNSPREQRYVWNRNPYYWKVDVEGRQLPYIGEVVHSFVQDREVANLQALTGQVDFQNRHMNGDNLTTFIENQDRENYRIVLTLPGIPGDTVGLAFNQTGKDEVLNTLFRNRDFRIGVSYAMDRDEMIQILLGGLGKPLQVASPQLFPFYDASLDTLHTQFDPERASEYFDRAGLRWNADRTVRLREDGAPLQIVFEVLDADAPLAELVVQNLNRVGIQATARVLERNLFDVRKNSYEFQMSTERWPGNPFTAPYIVAPFGRFSPVWGQYGAWVDSQGQEGVEPTGDAAKIAPAWKAVEGARTEAERMARLQEFYNLQRDNLWIVGLYSINRPGYFVVNDALRNVPDGAIAANFMRTPNNLWPWQFYFE